MTARLFRRLSGALLALAACLLQASPGSASGSGADPPTVVLAEVDSIIQPVSAEFMIETINRAEADHAALVVFTLRTPGGLVDSTRDVVTRMLATSTPVAITHPPMTARSPMSNSANGAKLETEVITRWRAG